MQRTNTIVAYRGFLSAHSINFAHGEGKRFGLSTTSEKLGKYKDNCIEKMLLFSFSRVKSSLSSCAPNFKFCVLILLLYKSIVTRVLIADGK